MNDKQGAPTEETLKEIVDVVLREMRAIGLGWRYDWHGFDGKTLRGQLDDLAVWAEHALSGGGRPDYDAGTAFMKERLGELGLDEPSGPGISRGGAVG